ncbi:MAG: Unknown protein [uncultured Thiotrichaceae bacterium]|uniref:Uncharacterized protein n=1 Tax=uncultured Thiotrichaceae bacterium TaxID=298394 RepID=A0A6S6TIW3_9GAMM|nr:MAG: Unknown protein [uncultured Thiotrichaceae bacterium]
MSHAKHKLSITLNEHDNNEDIESDEADSVDSPEEETEVWQFDGGICG